MERFAGLDVSQKCATICVVDDDGVLNGGSGENGT